MPSYNNKFAPATPPRSRAKGGRRFPLLASAATSFDYRKHRSSDTALGRRLVMCRSTSAFGRTGRRFAGLGCHGRGFYPAFRGYVPPKYLAGAFIGSGPFANLRSQPRRQAFADLPKRHLVVSVINAPNLDRGEDDEIHEHSTSGEANDC
jgi:hypothetical protein